MKIFRFSNYYSLDILALFSLFSNIAYLFWAIYFFNFKTCNGTLCSLDPFIFSFIYYTICIVILVIIFVLLLIEFLLKKKYKDMHINYSTKTKIILAISCICTTLSFIAFTYFLTFLLKISANID